MYFHVTSNFFLTPPLVPPPSLFVSIAPSCPSSFPPFYSSSFSFSTSLLPPHLSSPFTLLFSLPLSLLPPCHIFPSLLIPLPAFFHLSFPFPHVTPLPSQPPSVRSIILPFPLSFHFFCSCWTYLTWPLRNQAACKEATRGPMAFKSFPRDLAMRIKCLDQGHYFRAGIRSGDLRYGVCGLIRSAMTPPQVISQFHKCIQINGCFFC